MNTYKAYKFRIYPTNEQKILIEKTFGCTRYIYNKLLEERIKIFEEKKILIKGNSQLKKLTEIKNENEWLKEVDQSSLFKSVFKIDDAFQNFFRGNGYPKYKMKGVHESYTTVQLYNDYKNNKYESIKIDWENRTITLPKLENISFSGYKNVKKNPGKIKSATISKTANKYYASFLIEVPFVAINIHPKSVVGLDLGIKDFIVTSYGEKIKNEIKINQKRLKGLQKGLSRCKPKSKNRYKIQMKIQTLYQKIKNARKHFIHLTVNKILKENDIISTESLDIKNMYKNHSIAKCLSQISMGEFLRVLKYKAQWLGKYVIEIDKFYPSSQICSRCNYKNSLLKNLNIREWICPKCGCNHDRDINASENIMFEGLCLYMKKRYN